MLPWPNHRHRCLPGSAGYIVVACGLVLATSPLAAQNTDTPDIPAARVEDAPLPKPVPAQPAAPVSAATVIDSNLTPTELSALSPAAGPTPVSGPGSVPAPSGGNLGDRLNSANTATRLPFRVTATLGEIYSNNIFSSKVKTDDYITRLSATGEVRLGALQNGQQQLEDANFFDFVYTPTLRLYADHSDEDGVDHDVDVFYAHRWTKLTVSLEQSFLSEQSNNASVGGGLVTADTYTTQLTAKYIYSPKADFIASFKQQFADYDDPAYTDSKEWSGEFHGLYHFDPKISLGFGPRFGYLDLHGLAAETYQQALAHFVYTVNDKTNFQGTAGVEDRQYQTYKRSDTFEPIFEMSGAYRPTPSTNLSFVALRQFTPSYGFEGNDYIDTSIYLGATQRFFSSYYAGVKVGYENDDYDFNLGGPTREDNYYFISPSVRWRPNGWLEVAAFDKYEEDSSNFNAFSYDTNQVGVSCSATY